MEKNDIKFDNTTKSNWWDTNDLSKMVFMVWYHDIIANDSHIFLNSTIMCAYFKHKKWKEKMKSFFFKLKKIIYI